MTARHSAAALTPSSAAHRRRSIADPTSPPDLAAMTYRARTVLASGDDVGVRSRHFGFIRPRRGSQFGHGEIPRGCHPPVRGRCGVGLVQSTPRSQRRLVPAAAALAPLGPADPERGAWRSGRAFQPLPTSGRGRRWRRRRRRRWTSGISQLDRRLRSAPSGDSSIARIRGDCAPDETQLIADQAAQPSHRSAGRGRRPAAAARRSPVRPPATDS